ncbi:putative sulfate exporter family transporter [Chitinophaga caeni]|uniref:Putative sulfate exporter family transporter n=1 Tax=Chitinophaga caeni TaxID=2029983 RepID=A0A291QX25_9BACT|nr:putative sulfate exporter family transporter [Chitinophaga caeni]ATL48432.1 putative sulfate exporter family transporter [Chitinophaga caeni]
MLVKKALHEDWIAVIVAFLSMFIIITFYGPQMPRYSWYDTQTFVQELGKGGNYLHTLVLFAWATLALILYKFLNKQERPFSVIPGMVVVMLISMLAQFITSNHAVKNLGIEIVLFSLLIGLFLSNVTGIPSWVKPAIQTEFFIKTGLVLLGAGIIFHDILKGGALGILQSVVVVFTVWYFAFWVCKKFKLDDEFKMMISSAVSICGVSAAIATSGAIEGDNKKLSHVISLVLIIAIPMMLFMPMIANALGLSEAVAGAWLGGTIDTSGAVVAAGTILGDEALKYATLVKFSQNVLLGIAAFFISVYWTYRKNGPGKDIQERPGLASIWQRFPKFVLGFVLASLVFSFLLNPDVAKAAKAPIKDLQTCFFALAFACIGLETKFTDIFKMENGRPAMAFIIAQVFNIFFTLIMAYLIFK